MSLPLGLSEACLGKLVTGQFWHGLDLYCDERERSIVSALKTCKPEDLGALQAGIKELNVLRRLGEAVETYANSLKKPIDT